jgi:TIGR03009 family protein
MIVRPPKISEGIMRTTVGAACVLLSVSAWGQLPPAVPERAKRLDQILAKWEAVMTQATSLEAECQRTFEDKIFGATDVYTGTLKFLKGNVPGSTRASLYLKNAAKPEQFEQMVLSGSHLYVVNPGSKEIHDFELSRPAAKKENRIVGATQKLADNVADNLVSHVGLLLGTKAAEAKKRYSMEFESSDATYDYLRIQTKTPNDKANFEVAQLALIRASSLPRQLRLMQANGNRVTWDLPNIKMPAALGPGDFAPPSLSGFKMIRVPSDEPISKSQSP